jgi:hypothetical protein
MGLSNGRPYGAAESRNGDGVSTNKNALFTIYREIIKRQREDVSETSAAVEEKGSKENDKKSKE